MTKNTTRIGRTIMKLEENLTKEKYLREKSY
jgi:hypothetical protein